MIWLCHMRATWKSGFQVRPHALDPSRPGCHHHSVWGGQISKHNASGGSTDARQLFGDISGLLQHGPAAATACSEIVSKVMCIAAELPSLCIGNGSVTANVGTALHRRASPCQILKIWPYFGAMSIFSHPADPPVFPPGAPLSWGALQSFEL